MLKMPGAHVLPAAHTFSAQAQRMSQQPRYTRMDAEAPLRQSLSGVTVVAALGALSPRTCPPTAPQVLGCTGMGFPHGRHRSAECSKAY